jgi:hypothetical protein
MIRISSGLLFLPFRDDGGESNFGKLVSRFERCLLRVGIPYPAPASGLKTSPKRGGGCRLCPVRFLSRVGFVEAPFRVGWSRFRDECGFDDEDEAGVFRGDEDDDGWSNCFTRSFMRPGRVGIGLGFEAGVGMADAGFETDR